MAPKGERTPVQIKNAVKDWRFRRLVSMLGRENATANPNPQRVFRIDNALRFLGIDKLKLTLPEFMRAQRHVATELRQGRMRQRRFRMNLKK